MGKKVTPEYDMPNMKAVASETRSVNDPYADYDLAQIGRRARAEGRMRRLSR